MFLPVLDVRDLLWDLFLILCCLIVLSVVNIAWRCIRAGHSDFLSIVLVLVQKFPIHYKFTNIFLERT